MLQLSAAVASLTLVSVVGVKGLLGLGPAIVLACGRARRAAGRARDGPLRPRAGARRSASSSASAAAASPRSAARRVGARRCCCGLVGVGAASGTALLARTAAGDMYPPEQRAHGIALVLFGAVFGAILGPLVFSPLLHGRELDGDALALLWLAAGGFMLVALVLVLFVRPDPKRIAELLRHPATPPREAPAAPLREIVRRPGAIPALLAGQASFGVMVGVMTLTGSVVVDHQHHAGHDVFPIIGAHVLGMYALVLVIGELIDRIGRTPRAGRRPAGDGGLGLEPAVGRVGGRRPRSCCSASGSAGTSRSSPPPPSSPTARARPSAASCSASTTCSAGLTGAGLALLGGLALSAIGVAALAIGGTALVVVPALWILLRPPTAAPSAAL